MGIASVFLLTHVRSIQILHSRNKNTYRSIENVFEIAILTNRLQLYDNDRWLSCWNLEVARSSTLDVTDVRERRQLSGCDVRLFRI